MFSILWKTHPPLPVPRRQSAPHLLFSGREFGDYPMKALVGAKYRDRLNLFGAGILI